MVYQPKTSHKKPIESESGAIRKDHGGRIKIALVYPNTYPVGMSNLGFQTVYRLFNDMDHVVCERAFLPRIGPFSSTDLKTIETRQPLHYFDIIAFSISFENDYPNLLSILDKAKIPLLSEKRSDDDPLIIAGGVACFLNPEPISSFIDCFLIGEAEPVLSPFIEAYDPEMDKKSLLESLARSVPGVYVPSLYNVSYDSNGIPLRYRPLIDMPEKISRIYVEDLSDISTTSSVITPDTPFGKTFLIETGRGCPHGCRFCSAGYVYRPPRFRTLSQLSASLDEGMAVTDRIGLVGAAITDLPDLKPLCDRVKDRKIRVSFSSLRADKLSSEVISVLQKSKVKTATIAPDAGSERMRKVIKKGILEADILSAAEKLVSAGILNLKLYFMVGLPTETEDDIRAIVDLCLRIKKVFLQASRIKKRMGTITVSLNPFVPKPFTPFQWAAMDETNTIKRKIKTVKDGLKSIPNIRVIAEKPRQAYIQALLSRGDRQVGKILLRHHKNRQNWAKTLKEVHVDPDFYVLRERNTNEILPWQFIDHGYDAMMLLREYERAKKT